MLHGSASHLLACTQVNATLMFMLALVQVPMTLEDTLEDPSAFPAGVTDVHQQQLDLRSKTRWGLGTGAD